MKTIEKAVILGFVFTLLISITGFKAHCDNIEQKVLRLHVIANSDTKEDQELKLKVRDRVLSYSKDIFVDVADKKFYGDINNGKANVTIEGVDAGNYTANVKFFGDEIYNEATCTADVKVSESKIITELKEQLADAVGQYIHVSLYQAVDKSKTFEGTLLSFEEDHLTMEYRDKTRKKVVQIPYRLVSKARLAVKF